MYAALYESMIAWYARRGVASGHRHWYAVTTLTSMGNTESFVTLFANHGSGWAIRVFMAGQVGSIAAAYFVGLFVLHVVLFRKRVVSRPAGSAGHAPRITPAYVVVSVALALYASDFALYIHQGK